MTSKRKGGGRITKTERMNWRTLPAEHWNTLTFTEYFRDKNRELYGVEYAPLRNWRFEQGVIKRALDEYGPEILRAAFDECFNGYRPTRAYPILTAGFAVAYRINSIVPRLLSEKADAERRESEKAATPVNAAELKAIW
ncbi:hypothetical protein M6D81_11310 [Paenibacillus sp. J5C_2022]|uniref:hypothetical protein n=1 Tax=Paenibacillus sp. J5C2022 TaxID=2977129 RepID=UPI0021CF66A1|nr:hypothetical protein [Paenibacillus sp. J5C2022]MCU6709294.1 hypothetical protein [Paenibacillus sp. J5C2022]